MLQVSSLYLLKVQTYILFYFYNNYFTICIVVLDKAIIFNSSYIVYKLINFIYRSYILLFYIFIKIYVELLKGQQDLKTRTMSKINSKVNPKHNSILGSFKGKSCGDMADFFTYEYTLKKYLLHFTCLYFLFILKGSEFYVPQGFFVFSKEIKSLVNFKRPTRLFQEISLQQNPG